MIVPAAELELIVNPRIRKRTLTIPVRYGPLGERKKCPVREGSVRTLESRAPYETHKTVAERQPTRARAVLALIDLCDVRRRDTKITVRTVSAPTLVDGQLVYEVGFVKGDQAAVLDQPVFMAPSGSGADYTLTSSRQATPGEPLSEVMMPLQADIEKARQRAKEGQLVPQREMVGKLRQDVDTCLRVMTDMKLRNRLRLAMKELEKIEVALSVQAGATMLASSGTARQAPADTEGEPRPCGKDVAPPPMRSAA